MGCRPGLLLVVVVAAAAQTLPGRNLAQLQRGPLTLQGGRLLPVRPQPRPQQRPQLRPQLHQSRPQLNSQQRPQPRPQLPPQSRPKPSPYFPQDNVPFSYNSKPVPEVGEMVEMVGYAT